MLRSFGLLGEREVEELEALAMRVAAAGASAQVDTLVHTCAGHAHCCPVSSKLGLQVLAAACMSHVLVL